MCKYQLECTTLCGKPEIALMSMIVQVHMYSLPSQFDISSAFVARASKKQAQQVAKGKTAPSSSAGNRTVAPSSHEYTLEQNTKLQSHSSSSISSDSSSSKMNGVPPATNYHSKTPAVNTPPKGNISKVCVYSFLGTFKGRCVYVDIS